MSGAFEHFVQMQNRIFSNNLKILIMNMETDVGIVYVVCNAVCDVKYWKSPHSAYVTMCTSI